MSSDEGEQSFEEILEAQATEFDNISPELLGEIYQLEVEHSSMEERHEIEGKIRKIIEGTVDNNEI